MGLLEKIFGKKTAGTSKGNRTNKTKNHFITNSDQFDLGHIELAISGAVRIDGILAIAALDKIAKQKGLEFKYSVMHTSLLEEGALTVPVVCSIGNDRYSVYFIYQEEELLKYLDLVNHVSKTSYPNLIYFSSIPIHKGYESKPIIEPFQLADLRYDKNAKAIGQYAMWWSTDDDPQFHKSRTFEYLSKLTELLNGYETYMTGYVLRQTRILQDPKLQRMQLPERHATYIIDALEEKKVVLDISQEKGIRFLFSIDNTTTAYRERFLKGVLVDFAANIIPLRQHDLPRDEKTDPNSYDWFNFMCRVVREKEEAGELTGHQIGLIDFTTPMN